MKRLFRFILIFLVGSAIMAYGVHLATAAAPPEYEPLMVLAGQLVGLIYGAVTGTILAIRYLYY